MGYRSDVYIKMDREIGAEFRSLVKEIDAEFFSYTDNLDDGYLYAKACYLKWYDGYEQVDTINSWVNDKEERAGMIVIGEDGAVTEYGDCCSVDMWVVTTVNGFDKDM
jgi:hypothetical protein